ncbi:MAG: LysM peptidoglycan-binding domain-containing protein [Thermacetogeniaceae bacterium]
MRKVLSIAFSALFFCLALSGTSFAATYTVQPGDTYYLIAQQYNLTAEQLMAANGYTSSNLWPGQVLTIPGDKRYTVVAGDYLYQIAQNYGTTVDSLIALNHLSADSQGKVAIYPGQLLLLAGSSSSGIAEASGIGSASQQYTVRPGDTLDQIAQQYGTTIDAIVYANSLTDTTIYPGQQLVLPGSGSNAQASSRFGLTANDTYVLAQLINAEAGGEPFDGQVAVGAVVLNRLLNPNFPKTIKDIVFQHDNDTNTYQFEPVLNGTIYEPPCSSALRAAYAALTGWDPTAGALYFYNPQKAKSSFFDTWLTYLAQIGNHLFYK